MPAVPRVLAAGGLILLLAGCGSAPAPVTALPASAAGSAPGPARASTGRPAAVPTASPPASSATPPVLTTPARRPLVVLDPGHNGGNASHGAAVTRLVDAGHGKRKPCNEVGAESRAGYPEHAFAWDVTVRLRALLTARGVDVRLTRPNDTGVGPCVDVRGRYGNALRADAVVSVHADGGPPGGSGFHVIEAARPAGAAAADQRLALAVRASMLSGSGLQYATYAAGGDGLDVRDDLAGLTLSSRPSVMVEAGNMANRGDAALQSSAAGRQRIASALAAGILAFLGIE